VELNQQSGGRRDGLVERSSGTQLPDHEEHTTGQLVTMLSEQVSVLIRDELKLARLEMTSKGKQAALGAGLFGASGVIAMYGVGCLLACAIIAISGAVAAWLAALIVGAALLTAAGCAAPLGKRRLARAAPPVPEQAVASVKADVEEIKERAHR
jgi:Putative Actinobacterial Holin-X, holin superfamily III